MPHPCRGYSFSPLDSQFLDHQVKVFVMFFPLAVLLRRQIRVLQNLVNELELRLFILEAHSEQTVIHIIIVNEMFILVHYNEGQEFSRAT